MPNSVDAYASEPHYEAHIRPVFDALPDGLRGTWARRGDGPVIVAGYKDMLGVGDRPVILMEHGAGQTYGSGHPSYAGGRNRERVKLFLCPSERVAEANRARYPQTPAVVVGCPKMDALLGLGRVRSGIVGFAWHWNALVCPESRSALNHYARSLGDIDYPSIGTAHPRIMRHAAKVYADAGIDVVDAVGLFKLAEVLVVDNSSIGWEFLALDRPVVWANAPWYRREAHHGLRFWELADSGVQCDGPEELPDAIAEAFADSPAQRERRRTAAATVYEFLDGRSAGRAAAAIVERFGG
jgi:hypothetical protein